MKTKIADLEFEPLIKAEAIDERIKAIGLQLNHDYRNSVPVFVGVLNGSFLFIASTTLPHSLGRYSRVSYLDSAGSVYLGHTRSVALIFPSIFLFLIAH